MIIVPGILEQDLDAIVDRIESIMPVAKHVQIDICDGQYVESQTWPYSVGITDDEMSIGQSRLQKLKQQGMTFELDLMVRNPETTLVRWLDLGPIHIWIHIDSTDAPERCLAILHGYQMDHPRFTYGIAVMNSAPIEKYHRLLRMVYAVQVMGIDRIGVQGQDFNSATYGTVDTIREIEPEIPIQVDGGVSLENSVLLGQAHVSSVVCGSALFATGEPVENFDRIRISIDTVNNQ